MRGASCLFAAFFLVLFASLNLTQAQSTTAYEYDVHGRVTKVTYPNGSSVYYQYDAAGNRTISPTGNTPPTLTVSPNWSTGSPGFRTILRTKFTAYDADGDPLTYELRSLFSGGGYFRVNGINRGVGPIQVNSADWQNTHWIALDIWEDFEEFEVRVTDGQAWSPWVKFFIETEAEPCPPDDGC